MVLSRAVNNFGGYRVCIGADGHFLLLKDAKSDEERGVFSLPSQSGADVLETPPRCDAS